MPALSIPGDLGHQMSDTSCFWWSLVFDGGIVLLHGTLIPGCYWWELFALRSQIREQTALEPHAG